MTVSKTVHGGSNPSSPVFSPFGLIFLHSFILFKKLISERVQMMNIDRKYLIPRKSTKWDEKWYAQLWFIICMCVIVPPFGLILALGFKNPKTTFRRAILVILTLIHWGVWLYISNVLYPAMMEQKITAMLLMFQTSVGIFTSLG